MSVMGSWRLLNAIENKLLDGTALEALVSTEPRRYNELAALIGTGAMIQRVASVKDTINALLASPTALSALLENRHAVSAISNSRIGMTAVAESPIAMEAIAGDAGLFSIIAASSNAMSVVANTEAAMVEVAGNQVAMEVLVTIPNAVRVVFSSTIGKLALWNEDLALNVIFNSDDAFATLRGLGTIYERLSNGSSVVFWDSGVTPENLDPQGKYLFMGASWEASFSRDLTISTRRIDSTMSDVGMLGESQSVDADGFFSLCPIEGPHTTQLSSSGGSSTYISLLRCDE